jgi:hypothetical protein
MSKFYSALMLARHVSDLIGLSSGAFCTSCICRLWYVVIRVLLDTSSRCKVVGRTFLSILFSITCNVKRYVESTSRPTGWIHRRILSCIVLCRQQRYSVLFHIAVHTFSGLLFWLEKVRWPHAWYLENVTNFFSFV